MGILGCDDVVCVAAGRGKLSMEGGNDYRL